MPLHSRTRVRTLAAATGLALLLAGCSSEVERDEATGQVTEVVEDADIFQLKVGDCYNNTDPNAELIESLPIVPCSEPHLAEVYHAFDVPDGDTFPGQAVIDAETEKCIGEPFTAFIGLPYQESVFSVLPFTPTAQSWEIGDREILCTVTDPAGDTTGTLAGANR
jgi:hypothetical protein